VKKVYQYVRIKEVDIKNLSFSVKNYYDFTNLNNFQISWEVTANGESYLKGQIPIFDLHPYDEQVITIREVNIKSEPGIEYYINFTTSTLNDAALVDAGHVVAIDQFNLPSLNKNEKELSNSPKLEVDQKDQSVSISGKEFEVEFDLTRGNLSKYLYQGTELIKTGPEINFWRAPTDNDFGNGMQIRCKIWKDAVNNIKITSSEIDKLSSGQVSVIFDYEFPEIESTLRTIYTVNGNGDIQVQNEFEPGKKELPALPRFGMNMSLFEQYEKVSWYGRGPHENYWDRKTSALVGKYFAQVSDLDFPYIRPQENGYRTDVRWVSFVNSKGVGLKFTGEPLICFSAHHNTIEDFDPGINKLGKHTIDIKKRNLINLNIDYKQTGVAGDNSWGARPYQKYTLFPQPYSYSFKISLVKGK